MSNTPVINIFNNASQSDPCRYCGIAPDEDTMPWPEYVAWQHALLTALWDHLTDNGAIFYNHKTRVIGGRLWKPDELIPGHLIVRQEIVWARAGGMNYNPTAYVPTHERIFVLAKEAWRLKSKGAAGVGDVWRFPQEPSPHPAPFPTGLPARAIETTGPCIVLDPHAGSGSTLVAALAAGVPVVGIEKSEAYCDMAVKRLAQGSLFAATEREPVPVGAPSEASLSGSPTPPQDHT